MSIPLKSVRLANGVSLPYLEQGAADGAPMLLIHGYSDSSVSYEPVLDALPPGVRAFAVTLRGHGDADRPPAGYGLPDFANDLALFIEELDLGPVIVVGHSMGSAVAQTFAIEHPELLRGLVLVGSFVTMRENAVVRELGEAVLALTDPVDPVFVRGFQESTLAEPVPALFLERIIAESLKMPASVWKAAYEGMMSFDLGSQLDSIEVPVLAIWGERDAIFNHDDWTELAKVMPRAHVELYSGAGHSPHWEQPTRFAAQLAGFVHES